MSGLNNPALQAKLQELEKELEEGDITQKGYQKRRSQLLAQYGATDDFEHPQPSPPPPRQNPKPGGLRIHRPEDYSHLSNEVQRPSPHSADSGGSAVEALPATLLAPGGPMAEHRPSMRQHDSLFLAPAPNEASTRSGTMVSGDYAFNPEHGPYADVAQGNPYDSRTGTLLDSQAYFSDFAEQGYEQGFEQSGDYAYGGPQRYSGDAFSPTAAMAPPMLTANDLPQSEALDHLMPLEPRDLPFPVCDPHDNDKLMADFDNIASVLRHRGRTAAKLPAYWVLDSKGKETASITWDKLASRAEKVAQVIRDKSSLYRGDRVALIYRDSEVIEFAIALLGCFIAGVVAVPINDLQDYPKLNMILTNTQAHLALTTDNNLKAFQRDITTQKLTWPKGVEWWKTNEFGGYSKRKDDVTALSVPDLAYIEFSRAPTGDLRGVVLSHRTIMHQMGNLSAIFSSVPGNGPGDTFNRTGDLRDKNGRLIGGAAKSEVLLSYLDPRQGIGMILGVLYAVYGGHTTVWMESKAVDVPGLYAHLITKYKPTLMAADYPGLKRAAYDYQNQPMITRNFKKGMEPNFSTVKLCLIDTLTADPEFNEILADRWFRPLRNPRAREVVAPMLCLPEHGGMLISVRDWLGGEERMGCPLKLETEVEAASEEETEEEAPAPAPASESAAALAPSTGYDSLLGGSVAPKPESTPPSGYRSLLGGPTAPKTEQRAKTELSEVLLDREALKSNEVVVVAIGEEVRKRPNEPGTIRVGAFGYPIPDASLAIVDPETGLLASQRAIGEIWVDSPCLSGGFWGLPKHTEGIFHARPYKFEPGNPTPTAVDADYLRTGLLGTVIEGKIYVLGLYEDRIRQKVEWVEHGAEAAEYRYFFVQHLVVTLLRNIRQVVDCSAFDVYVNEEHLPVVVLESQSASTAPATNGGPPRQLDVTLLDVLAERCMDILMQEHHLRVYCVMITAPNALPRVVKNGRREIGNMLCRREFDLGNLPCVHVKFAVEHAVLNLPIGIDPIGGIWSPTASAARSEMLVQADRQYSGIDRREVVIDDRTSTPLNNFATITDLIQWRVARQPEEPALCTIDGRGKEGKGVTWKKFDTKIASVAMYLKNKVKLRPGDHVVLMYTHSEDFVYAVHACLNLGIIAIPLAPLDQNRLGEDVPAFLHMVKDYSIRAVLVNQEVDHLLKAKAVSTHLKTAAGVINITVPTIWNTTKPPKQNSGLRDLGLTVDPAWAQPNYPALIWTYWSPDQRRTCVQLGHDTILGMCKVQKETCQMTSSRPVLGCVRSTTGLGFIHTCLMGIYIGTPTYLLSPIEFAQNPASLFMILSRYKIKDTYATPQMLDHAMSMMAGKGFTLHELKNMMISAEGRPRVDVFQKVRLHFAAAGLDRTAINTVYSHNLNPMIASRSYMCIEPIELWLDAKALRRGLVYPADPEQDPKALLVQDSGMVPVSTHIAIVNPESCQICSDGEYGEIWVDSEANVKMLYRSRDVFDINKFNGHTVEDPSIRYVRTGDVGFLHNISRPIGPGGVQVDMQVLFVLGCVGETIEVNGLSHFPVDIEATVERCHRNIVPNGCAVFQAGGLVVVVIEVSRKAYLASIVPVIVNSILNEHQIIVDIVAFVSKGDFPRSRLHEKQRGKVLAGWVSRKMRTMAQFAIRETLSGPPGTSSGETVPPGTSSGRTYTRVTHRDSLASFRSGGQGYPAPGGGSSLRNIEYYQQQEGRSSRDSPTMFGAAEMPADPMRAVELDATAAPVERADNRVSVAALPHGYDLPDFDRFGDDEQKDSSSSIAPPAIGPKPTAFGAQQQQNPPPMIRLLPGVDGVEQSFDFTDRGQGATLERHGGGGKLPETQDDDYDWSRDTFKSMNLASMQDR